LPNEKNNPDQKELYKAFASGDVEAVKQIPRRQRKQIFVTNMSVYFTDDISTAEFGGADFLTKGRKSKAGDMAGMPPIFMFQGMGMPGMTAPKFAQKAYKKPGEEGEGGGAGFVVTIAGYTPYKDIGELMDPVGVEGDPNKWGVVTRLLHLDEVVGGNSPFELYKKAEVEHFKLEIGEVAWDAEMPLGVGIEDNKSEEAKKGGIDEEILIDPMTKEIISRVAELDEYGTEKVDRSGNVVYEVNDHWFRIDVKFIWKDAPKPEPEEVGSGV
jgi:type IV pilus assembly protein PilM